MAFLTYDHHYINGDWVKSTNPGHYLEVIDSSSGQPCAKVPEGTAAEMSNAIDAAREAFPAWSQTPLAERKAAMQRILANWQTKKEKCVEWLQKELGCTKTFATTVQSNMVDMHFGTAINHIDQVKFEEKTPMGGVVVKEPIGVVGCITPWNYPLNQIAAKICPAMLVGCTVVLKPSEVTPINAFLLAEAIHEAGLPKGVFNMVNGTGTGCAETLTSHPSVDLISFTGSTRAGKQISIAAAQTLKVVRTELGGKSAALMLDDADLQKLVPMFMGQLMSNTGQSCNALSRMLVPTSRYEEALQIAQQVAENTKVGRPADPEAAMGPLVSQAQWDRVQGLIQKGVEEGARVLVGGLGKPEGLEDGFFVKPQCFQECTTK